MYFYFKSVESDLSTINNTRIFVEDFEPRVNDYITVGTETYKIVSIEHKFSIDGKYGGTCIHVKNKQQSNWRMLF